MKIRYYIASFRLRTLPLSLSGVFLGTLLAAADGSFDPNVFVWVVLTTLCLQILSNMTNEWGDLQKGTDNVERLGPIRSIQSGKLTLKEFKHTIIVFLCLSVIFGTILVYSAFDCLFTPDGGIMLALGATAIVAAIKYTVGKGAYGYHGLGDLSVFLFFGLLSVAGSYFLMAHRVDSALFWAASAIGLCSTGVLNLNNMRDMENDRKCRKRTLPVMMGIKNAKIYHSLLVGGGIGCMCTYTLLHNPAPVRFIFLITLPLFLFHLIKVTRSEGRQLDSQLKVLSLTTLLFALLGGWGQLL